MPTTRASRDPAEPVFVRTDGGAKLLQLDSGELVMPSVQREYPRTVLIGGRDWHHVRELPDGRWVYRYDR